MSEWPNPINPNYKYQEARQVLGAGEAVGTIAKVAAEDFISKSRKEKMQTVGAVAGGVLLAGGLIGGPILLSHELNSHFRNNHEPTPKVKVGGHEPGPRRSEGHAQAETVPVGDQFEEIGALQGIASREHNVWRERGARQLSEHARALVRRELVERAGRHRFRPAVAACEVARAGELPVHARGRLVQAPGVHVRVSRGTTSRRSAPV